MSRRIAVATLLVALALTACAPAPACEGRSCTTAAPSTPASPIPETTPATPEEWARDRVAAMTVEQKAGSLLMLHAPGLDPVALRALIEQGAGGLILMGDNVPDAPEQLAALTSAVGVDAEAPPLIGIDEEGGEVVRLPWDGLPGAEVLRGQPPEAARAAFAERAALLAASGVDVNFGIVADVTADPESFLAGRVLGTDPVAAAERVAAAVTGERGTVASTLKHFPGHGAAAGDSHESLPTATLSLEDWRAATAVPFAAGIDAGAEVVMTGHLVYPQVDAAPASLSPRWHAVLRDELGFDGVVVTDDLLMLQRNGVAEFADPNANAVRAVAAGADLLLFVLPADPSDVGVSVDGISGAIAAAVRDGRIPEARLDDAATRVMAMRHATVVAGDGAKIWGPPE